MCRRSRKRVKNRFNFLTTFWRPQASILVDFGTILGDFLEIWGVIWDDFGQISPPTWDVWSIMALRQRDAKSVFWVHKCYVPELLFYIAKRSVQYRLICRHSYNKKIWQKKEYSFASFLVIAFVIATTNKKTFLVETRTRTICCCTEAHI